MKRALVQRWVVDTIYRITSREALNADQLVYRLANVAINEERKPPSRTTIYKALRELIDHKLVDRELDRFGNKTRKFRYRRKTA